MLSWNLSLLLTRRPRLRIEPFKVAVAEQVLSELKTRIRNTRWPDSAPDAPWSQGTDLEWLRNLMDYWAEEFGSSADTISSTGRKCPVGAISRRSKSRNCWWRISACFSRSEEHTSELQSP